MKQMVACCRRFDCESSVRRSQSSWSQLRQWDFFTSCCSRALEADRGIQSSRPCQPGDGTGVRAGTHGRHFGCARETSPRTTFSHNEVIQGELMKMLWLLVREQD